MTVVSIDRLKELLEAKDEDRLSHEEEDELLALLEGSRAARQGLVEHYFLTGELESELEVETELARRAKAEEGRSERSTAVLAKGAPRRGPRPAFVVALAATAVVVMTVGWGLGRESERRQRAQRPEPASIQVAGSAVGAPDRTVNQGVTALTVQSVRGAVAQVTGGGRVDVVQGGLALSAEASIETGPDDSALTVGLADGSRLVIGPHTAISSITPASGGRPARVLLDRGAVHLEAAPGAAPSMLIVTSQGELASAGARWGVVGTLATTRVDVEVGTVIARRFHDGRETTVGAGQYALLSEEDGIGPFAQRGPVLMAVGRRLSPSMDRRVAARLRSLGLDVVEVEEGALTRADLEGKSLLYLSSSTDRSRLPARLRDVAVPIVNAEFTMVEELGLGKGGGRLSVRQQVLSVVPHHPVAATFSGLTRVTQRPTRFALGMPGEHAWVVATVPEEPDGAALFAYERGAPMPGGVAPARRVNLFFQHVTPRELTEEGWRLFDAAVSWAMGSAPAQR